MPAPPAAADNRLWAREVLAQAARKCVKNLVESTATTPRERDVLYMELDKLLQFLNPGHGYSREHGKLAAEVVVSNGAIRGARVLRLRDTESA